MIKRRDSLRIARKEEEVADSIRQSKALQKIVRYALSHQSETAFKVELNVNNDSTVLAGILYGHIFTKNTKHLLINSATSYSNNISVFAFKESKFKMLFRETVWRLSFVVDTLKDVNGDHINDLLINTYSSSGCCARSFYDVYIYNPLQDSFSTSYGFINPTFSSIEKMIRGVEYGHPGEVPLYKYKWNGNKIDTLEYIFPADTLKKKFYRVKRYGDQNNTQKRELLNAVPKEYINTIGYEWFIDY